MFEQTREFDPIGGVRYHADKCKPLIVYQGTVFDVTGRNLEEVFRQQARQTDGIKNLIYWLQASGYSIGPEARERLIKDRKRVQAEEEHRRAREAAERAARAEVEKMERELALHTNEAMRALNLSFRAEQNVVEATALTKLEEELFGIPEDSDEEEEVDEDETEPTPTPDVKVTPKPPKRQAAAKAAGKS